MTEDITLRDTINTVERRPLDDQVPPESSPQLSSQSPFTDERDAMSDFFEGGDRNDQMNEAIHLSQFGNNIALISGDTGSGKTFFLEQANYELSETASCCFIRGATDLSNEDIAKVVSSELAMPFATSQTLEQLIDMLDDADALQDVSRFIIIVDDIHLLKEDIIQSLLSLSQLSNSVFHLLASGLPSTLNFLESLYFQDAYIKEIHLFPFGLEDTRDYLNFKMQAAGYEGEEFFDPETVTTIYKESAGYPLRINQITEQYLLSKEDELSEDTPTEEGPGLPIWHMVGLVFLLFALILAFFYRGSEPTETEQSLPISLEENVNETATVDTLPTTDSTEAGATDQIEAATEAAAEQNAQTTINEPIAEAATQNPVESAIETSIDSIENSNGEIAETVSSTTSEAIDNALNTAETIAQNTEETIAETQNTPSQQAQTTEATTETTTEPAPETTAQSEPAPTPAPAAQTTTFTEDEQIVLNWPQGDSTIQIIGALDKASLEQYVAAQPNKDSLRLVTILRDNQPWHIVLAGHYADNAQARQAIQRLPQNQVNAGPWIRGVAELKQGIRAFRR